MLKKPNHELRVRTTPPLQSLLRALTSLAVVLWFASSASAEVITTGYSGTIDEIEAGLAAALPAETPISIGAPIVVNYSYESTTVDTDPSAKSGIYTGALQSFTLYIGSQVFELAPAGPKNEIDVLVDSLLNVYQPVTSVVASPALPIVANLEGDVIFLAVNASPLNDDSLIPPPAPGDPGWETFEAAITDDANKKLINAVLDTQCQGGCTPPTTAPPVPGVHPLLLAVVFVVVGVGWLAYSRRD